MTDSPDLALPTRAEVAGLRLVATDMDGTLLDPQHRVDPAFWQVVDRLEDHGIEVCAATGRQAAALAQVLGARIAALTLITDNGATVTRHGRVLHEARVGDDAVAEVAERIRALARSGQRVALAISGSDQAVIEGLDQGAIAEARVYYPNARVVEDVTTAGVAPVKVSVFDLAPITEAVVPALADLASDHTLLQGHEHWVDVNAAGTDKGSALGLVQRHLAVGADQTAAFGDHLNDLGLLGAASLSFAVANAQPEVLAAARFRAPANTRGGVVTALRALLALLD